MSALVFSWGLSSVAHEGGRVELVAEPWPVTVPDWPAAGQRQPMATVRRLRIGSSSRSRAGLSPRATGFSRLFQKLLFSASHWFPALASWLNASRFPTNVNLGILEGVRILGKK